MLIIPAIDIIGGKCVRLTKGDYNSKKIYDSDPLRVAKKFENLRFKMLHIIDLDGAKKGRPINKNLIVNIAKQIKIPIQVGGGIRTIKQAEEYLNSGVQRIIIGTKAIDDPKYLENLINKFGSERIVVSLDIKNNQIATNGWLKTVNQNYLKFSKLLKKIGITELIATDVSRDGTLTTPNFNLYDELKEIGFNLIAAGGISDETSIQKLDKMGLFGAVIGKAIYEGAIGQSRLQSRNNSNLTKRIIACMDIKNGRVVKGTNFKKLKDAGDPVELGKLYSDQGVDELVFLDIMATVENRDTFYKLVERIAKNINIPFTVGGGVKTVDDIRNSLNSGADKVSIGSAAVTNPDFVKQAVDEFGSQCIVISVDPKKRPDGTWEIYIKGGREPTGVDAIEFSKQMEELGAGELLVNSLDRDGMKTGYDILLLKAISYSVNIPVIASSGAGKKEDFYKAFTEGGCDAALAASLFHYRELEVGELKENLEKKGMSVRPIVIPSNSLSFRRAKRGRISPAY